jgi:hypothetical protein
MGLPSRDISQVQKEQKVKHGRKWKGRKIKRALFLRDWVYSAPLISGFIGLL